MKISFAEWFFLSLFCGAMLGIVIASQPPFYTFSYIHQHSIKRRQAYVDVYVRGEVEKPGHYRVQTGSTIQKTLAQAGLKESARTDKMNLDRMVCQGQIIKVPKKQKKRGKRESFVVEKSSV